ncbi:COR domain-containing protein, partial [Candidatus Sumerlaeota bacterium]
FYSERALFLLAFNARENYGQAKLHDWLEMIQARAYLPPEKSADGQEWKPPVWLVATHRDLWRPDIPIDELQKQFPRVRLLGVLEIGNKPDAKDGKRYGLSKLKNALRHAAAELPLMGQPWPVDWQRAEDAIGKKVAAKQSRLSIQELWDLMAACDVDADSRVVLARVLDHMGKIRVFLDDGELQDLVVLDPQWLTNRIAQVLKNEVEVDGEPKQVCKRSILAPQHWKTFWPQEDKKTHRLFVRLIQKFDLVYQLEGNEDHWLVVQLLPYQQPPAEMKERQDLWESFAEQPEITMRYRLEQSIPPGIPSWFIAREHRFSLGLHWRLGCLLADDPKSPKYLGMIQSYPEQRYLELTVRGPLPRDFFALLRDGLELTLDRYPGLKIDRMIPCPCPKGDCNPVYEFNFDDLETMREEAPRQTTAKCQKGWRDIPVGQLLYAEKPSPLDEGLDRLAEALGVVGGDVQTVLSELRQFREEVAYHHRTFLKEFELLQTRPDDECPNVFVLRPTDQKRWLGEWFSKKLHLQLYCQEPGHWHPTAVGDKPSPDNGLYEIDDPAKWLRTVSPYVGRLCGFLKYTMPLVGPGLGLAAEDLQKAISNDLKLMGELVKKLPEIEQGEPLHGRVMKYGDPDVQYGAEGAELRAVRALLEQKDKKQVWGGLSKKRTPEGHYLWLCAHHAEKYK